MSPVAWVGSLWPIRVRFRIVVIGPMTPFFGVVRGDFTLVTVFPGRLAFVLNRADPFFQTSIKGPPSPPYEILLLLVPSGNKRAIPMKISFKHAVSLESDDLLDVHEDVSDDTRSVMWESMEEIGAKNMERVQVYSDWITDDPLVILEGFDYAIMGISEYPREVLIYDYWKCIEVLMVGDGVLEEDAVDILDGIIATCSEENDPIFLQPFSVFDEEDLDDEL